ncbi:MAG: BolA family protein [Pontibacterium sp.]
MHADEVKKIIEEQLEGCTAYTSGEGCSFAVTVVGDQFEGLRPVKKQQLVYGCLAEHIASEAIHAVTIKAYTPEQWASLQK